MLLIWPVLKYMFILVLGITVSRRFQNPGQLVHINFLFYDSFECWSPINGNSLFSLTLDQVSLLSWYWF